MSDYPLYIPTLFIQWPLTLGSFIQYAPAKDSEILHTGAGHCLQSL